MNLTGGQVGGEGTWVRGEFAEFLELPHGITTVGGI